MGLREKLNENPAITTGATIFVIVVAVGFIIYSALPGGGPKIPTQAFYTVDDGTTWFADDIKKIAPFDKDGKPAVRAHVYKCGDKTFCAYMDRYTPEAKKQIEAFNATASTSKPQGKGQIPDVARMQAGARMQMISQTGVEYKKSGGSKWIRMMDDYQAFGQMMTVTCQDKGQAVEAVMP